MNFVEHIDWCKYQWLTRERWGSIHPGKPWNWYDPSAVTITPEGYLELKIHKNRLYYDLQYNIVKRTDELDSLTVEQLGARQINVSEYGTGLVCCDTRFQFGTFDIVAKLPKGDWFWTAFWMYAGTDPEDWRPEIDIFEAYSKTTGYKEYNLLSKIFPRLFSKVKSWNIESCIHTKPSLKLPDYGVGRPRIKDFNSDPSETFNKYTLYWTPTCLEFRINDVCVRRVTDPSIMAYLYKYDMMVLINTHIDGFGWRDFTVENTTPFVIQYFKHIPL